MLMGRGLGSAVHSPVWSSLRREDDADRLAHEAGLLVSSGVRRFLDRSLIARLTRRELIVVENRLLAGTVLMFCPEVGPPANQIQTE